MRYPNIALPDVNVASIQSYPAFDDLTLKTDSEGFVTLNANWDLTNQEGLGNWRISSVFTCALESNKCPLEAYERAKSFGHQIYFIYGIGSCLTNSKREKTARVVVFDGLKIKFQGKKFVVRPAANQNWHLEEIVEGAK